MSSLSKKDRVSLCLFTFSDNRRCRTPRIATHPHFCLYHAQEEAQTLATQKLSQELTYFLSGSYLTACDLSTALSRILPAVIRGDVKPKTARTIAYLAQTLLQSIRISQHEFINAYSTDTWRNVVRDSVKSDRDYLFPPKPAPTPPHPPPPPPPPPPPRHPTPPSPRLPRLQSQQSRPRPPPLLQQFPPHLQRHSTPHKPPPHHPKPRLSRIGIPSAAGNLLFPTRRKPAHKPPLPPPQPPVKLSAFPHLNLLCWLPHLRQPTTLPRLPPILRNNTSIQKPVYCTSTTTTASSSTANPGTANPLRVNTSKPT